MKGLAPRTALGTQGGPSRRSSTLLAVNAATGAARGILLNACRYAHPARLSQSFEPGRDVHSIAEDVARSRRQMQQME